MYNYYSIHITHQHNYMYTKQTYINLRVLQTSIIIQNREEYIIANMETKQYYVTNLLILSSNLSL